MDTNKLSELKKLEIKKLTVWVSDEYQDKLMDVEWKVWWEATRTIRDANKWLVSKLTDMSIDDINELTPSEYLYLSKKCWVIIDLSEAFNEVKKHFDVDKVEKKK